MKVRTAIRKCVKWGGAVAVVLLVAVWISSGWWDIFWYGFDTWIFSTARGYIRIEEYRGFTAAMRYGFHRINWCSVDGSPTYLWSFEYFDGSWGGGPKLWLIPLWFPTVLMLPPTILSWWLDRRATRRARIGHCPACGYDRRGLAAGRVCPECGAAAKAGVAA